MGTIVFAGPIQMQVEFFLTLLMDQCQINDKSLAAALGMQTALGRTGRLLPGEPWPSQLPMPDWDVESLEKLNQLL